MRRKNQPPRTYLPLNGTWQIQPGNERSAPESYNHHVPVPGLVDLAQPRYQWQKADYHWYRTVMKLTKNLRNRFAFLRIEQVMFGTDLYLNGHHLGGDIACYTSQEYDCTNYLKEDAANELLVRVGSKETLPATSAVGRDQERQTFIPGIWGDVCLLFSGNPRIKLVQTIPHVDGGIAEVKVWVENRSSEEVSVVVTVKAMEKQTGAGASNTLTEHVDLQPNGEHVVPFKIELTDVKLWSPDRPFLYEVESSILSRDSLVDQTQTIFGMREFKIVGSDFYFNGKKIFLRGGNIGFHRFLSDPDRGSLPWNPPWIKKILIDIPKEHNFNFFRNHLGQMYNRWYDIADEYGMLLQNEWQFWTTSGTKEQIRKEFTRWLEDNWNHPSIIIWDALNECSDDVVQKEIVPEMKKLDPTRQWESVDFVEQHPYIYSLGPVLVNRKFGFTESLEVIEKSPKPSVVNEFLWWWLDKNNQPTALTKDVLERWLGPHHTTEEVVEHQSFLAQELVELFRRMRVDAIQPFVYLSNNDGPTGHWFLGNIADLHPKPVLEALKNAFSPFGVSVELWDRHFFPGERRTIRLFVFNDNPSPRRGRLRYGIVTPQGEWLCSKNENVSVDASDYLTRQVEVEFPAQRGTYFLKAELYSEGAGKPTAFSRKIAHVFDHPKVPATLQEKGIALFDKRGEIETFLKKAVIPFVDFTKTKLDQCSVLIVGEGLVRHRAFQSRVEEIDEYVNSGGELILVEPEFGVEQTETIFVTKQVQMTIQRRMDHDRGGYDSYVFAEDHSHPLWNGIDREHLKIFNGAYGGEIVSQHTVTANAASNVLARCGLNLAVHAVMEIPQQKGRVLISRLQIRGRLSNSSPSTNLFDQRADPVAQRYVLNLISYSMQK